MAISPLIYELISNCAQKFHCYNSSLSLLRLLLLFASFAIFGGGRKKKLFIVLHIVNDGKGMYTFMWAIENERKREKLSKFSTPINFLAFNKKKKNKKKREK